MCAGWGALSCARVCGEGCAMGKHVIGAGDEAPRRTDDAATPLEPSPPSVTNERDRKQLPPAQRLLLGLGELRVRIAALQGQADAQQDARWTAAMAQAVEQA